MPPIGRASASSFVGTKIVALREPDMSKANRYEEFTIQEQENGPPLVLDRYGNARNSTRVERSLWDILNRDDDKARVAILKARVLDLETLLRRVIEWQPALPVEMSLADEIAEAIGPAQRR